MSFSKKPKKKNKQTNNTNVHKQQKNKTQKHKPNNKKKGNGKRNPCQPTKVFFEQIYCGFGIGYRGHHSKPAAQELPM
jgi:predicted adenine nucleotide alpha hydrolase (AANH) superfamily ATPase